MKKGRSLFGLPLLAKELIELAARRRTYVTRVVYAALLYSLFLWSNKSIFHDIPVGELNVWGSGWQMFLKFHGMQLVGIFCFLPAVAAGQVTYEKERDSLALLFLTELSPWQILLQKYAAALISIFSFLLIGMPLAALAYSFGGVSSVTLFTSIYVLFLTCLQVAAFALLCSAHFRTTVGAFLATYLGGFGIYYSVRMFGMFLDWRAQTYEGNLERCLSVFPATLFGDEIAAVLLGSVPSLAMTALFLLLARFYLVRRAFAPATNRLLALFRRIDAFMHNANRRFGNVTFRTQDRTLPKDDPIAWREMTRRSLGRPEYLVRVLLTVEPVILACCLFSGALGGHSTILAVTGVIAVLILSIFASNCFVSERLNQTLEVLLTTPLTATEIIVQKTRPLTRLMWVIAVPLMTVFVYEAWGEDIWIVWQPGAHAPRPIPLYPAGAALTAAIYLPLVMWLSIWIGLKVRTRFRAILTALGVIIGWCALPFFLAAMLKFNSHEPLGALPFYLSPFAFPAANESSDHLYLYLGNPWLTMAANFTFYCALAVFFRDRCLRHADRYLRG
jgi:ABC-type transport system involved in multi-copper enzyme maturation permease subunit